MAKLISRLLAIMCIALSSVTANAALIEYEIIFTQTWCSQPCKVRNIEGSFSVDDSIIGVGNENMSYGPYSSEMSSITNFEATFGGNTYPFDLVATQNWAAFSTILATDASGEVIDIQGWLRLHGTLSEIILGRDGREGRYTDVQQTGYGMAPPVSGGTYVVERVSPIPIPTAAWLFGSALLGLGAVKRKTISRSALSC